MEAKCVKVNIQDIEKRLKYIFRNRLEKEFDKMEMDSLDEHLLGYNIGLAPRDLIYLLRDIEEEFDIKICEEDIGTGRFSTFNNIMSLIYEQM